MFKNVRELAKMAFDKEKEEKAQVSKERNL
jgi:hypothetical protein